MNDFKIEGEDNDNTMLIEELRGDILGESDEDLEDEKKLMKYE